MEPKFFVPNKKVACAPLGKYRAVQMTGNTFKTAVQKGALLELSVVFSSGDYKKGDTVYIKGNCITLDWTKEEFTTDSVTFVLVPEDRIELVKKVVDTEVHYNPQTFCFEGVESSTSGTECVGMLGTANRYPSGTTTASVSSAPIAPSHCGCSNGCANPRCSSM